MGFFSEYLRVCIDSLFLCEDIFSGIKGMGLGRAFALVVFVGFIAGVAGAVGQSVRYYNEPSFEEIEKIWREPIKQQQHNAPWFSYMPREARKTWDNIYDNVWTVARFVWSLLVPSPARAFVGIFLGLFAKVLIWLLAGVILFVWSYIIIAKGVKNVHGLSRGRTVLALLLPFLLLFVIIFLVGVGT